MVYILVCTICCIAASNAGFILEKLGLLLFTIVLASVEIAARGIIANNCWGDSRMGDWERKGVLPTDNESNSKSTSWLIKALNRLRARRNVALSTIQSIDQVMTSNDRALVRRSLLKLDIDVWIVDLVKCLIIWSMQRSAEDFIKLRWK